jgi:uncharacterized protein (TIGR03435 family)
MRIAAFLLVGLTAARGLAQGPTTFDVSSIRPSPTGVNGPAGASFRVQPGGRLVATGATLRDLIVRAHGVQYFQVVGGEPWLSSVRFDVNASAGPGATPDIQQVNAMLRSLLEERFGVQVHRETRNLPVFSLALNGRRPGPRLRASTRDCRRVLEGRDPFESSDVDGDAGCQPHTQFVAGQNGSQISFARAGISMRQLALLLTPFVGRTVVDGTMLAGTYDIELTFSPESAGFITESGIHQSPQTEGLSVATALREQLGLKLQSARGPSEVLIVDTARRPTPD